MSSDGTRRRSRSPQTDGQPKPAQPAALVDERHVREPKRNVEMARTIKGQHVHIRSLVDKHGGDARQAWDAALADDQRLSNYARAMRDLAVQFWDRAPPPHQDTRASGARYNDRLGYIVGAVRRYYCGVRECDRAEGFEPGPPGIVAGPLKEAKRRFFVANAEQQMAPAAAAEWSASWLAERSARIGASASRLVVLDVGSCYNPLQPRFDSEGSLPLAIGAAGEHRASRVQVLGLDIAPHPEASNVCRCDWTRVQFHESGASEQLTMMGAEEDAADVAHLMKVSPSSAEEPKALIRTLAAGRADVVSFCLLLSYLPTPAMRGQCIVNAHRALRSEGLLVIVSTRTQGKRKADWIEDWVAAIQSVGFARVDKSLKAKIVGLTFRKCSDETPATIEPQLAEKLSIIADDVD